MTEQKAIALAYAYLNRRERTEAEVRSYLQSKEMPEAEADAAVGELLELGYVDDDRYARLFVQDKRNLQKWGAERIRRALRERGVDRGLVERALQTDESAGGDELHGGDALHGGEPSGELGRALELLRRRFPQPPADRRDRDRALGMMIRKGYDSELALDALSAYGREWRQ